MRLENKIALVTAAASGMGRAGVVRFAAEGAQVAVVDIDQAALDAVVKEVTDAGGDAVGINADLTKDDECHRIVDDTIDAFGGLDLLWKLGCCRIDSAAMHAMITRKLFRSIPREA